MLLFGVLLGREGVEIQLARAQSNLGLYVLFSNIFENIEGPAHFHIREYSREYRCPGRLFPQEYTSFPQPLTLVDLESKDILEYS